MGQNNTQHRRCVCKYCVCCSEGTFERRFAGGRGVTAMTGFPIFFALNTKTWSIGIVANFLERFSARGLKPHHQNSPPPPNCPKGISHGRPQCSSCTKNKTHLCRVLLFWYLALCTSQTNSKAPFALVMTVILGETLHMYRFKQAVPDL